ncbi:MAG TPA: CPBP family intramembrane glutamic endopeptidase [Candidatus Polarisedimenticolia bacterium]|jgi:membrane protease YdiL (CAAX protease family)
MDPLLFSTLMKLALPAVVITIALTVTRVRGISWKADLGLCWPRPAIGLAWLAAWIVWMAIGEAAIRVFGMEQAAPWEEYPLLIVVLRIAAIGILGPASEELVMRGVLLDRLRRTALGPIGAIAAVAAAWAAMHYRYEPMTIGLIFADGLVLGAARHHSRSTLLAAVMHSLGNLLSIYQSLHP